MRFEPTSPSGIGFLPSPEERELSRRISRVEHRLLRAEKSARRYRLLLLAMVPVLLLGAAQQGLGSRVVEAAAFVVRDDAGTIRAQLGVGEEGSALGLFDERGHLRAGLSVAPEGPMLNLFSEEGNPRVVVGERGDAAFVILRDRDGAPRAAMAIQADGTPSLYLLDETMAPIWRQPETQR